MTDSKRQLMFMTLAICSTLLLVALYLIDTAIGRLNAQLDRVKLKNEALLSEKLSIEKSLVSSQKKLTALKFSQESLSKELALALHQLQQRTSQNTFLQRQLNHSHSALEVAHIQRDSLLRTVVGTSTGDLKNNGTALNDSLKHIRQRYKQLQELLEADPPLDRFFIEDSNDKDMERSEMVSY